MEKEVGFAGRARNRCKCLRHGKEQRACREICAASLGKAVRAGVVSMSLKGLAEISAKDLMSCARWWALP